MKQLLQAILKGFQPPPGPDGDSTEYDQALRKHADALSKIPEGTRAAVVAQPQVALNVTSASVLLILRGVLQEI